VNPQAWYDSWLHSDPVIDELAMRERKGGGALDKEIRHRQSQRKVSSPRWSSVGSCSWHLIFGLEASGSLPCRARHVKRAQRLARIPTTHSQGFKDRG
jgi:hypothetical protein